MDVKLGETRFFDFVTADPATGFPAAIFSSVIDVHSGGSSSPLAYSPVLNTREGTGHYAATVAITTANGFAVDTNYAVSVTVTFTDGGQEYEIPLGNFMVRATSIDDVPTAASIAAAVWSYLKATAAALGTTTFGRYIYDTLASILTKTNQIGTGVTLNTPVSEEDSGTTITVFRTDDYTSTTGQQISVTVSGWPAFPSDGVKFRASRDNAATLIFAEVDVTVTVDGDDQTLTCDLTKEQVVLLRYGKLDDWRFEATYADTDVATPAWGKFNVVRVGT